MFKNYLKIAFRNMARSKGFSFINIAGLAIGMASAIIILLWIQNEVSYDRFHEKTDRLYTAWNRSTFDGKLQCWNTTPKILGPTIRQDYPEAEATTRVNWDKSLLFTLGDKRLNVTGTMVDPDFLTMFSFPLLKGNPHTALGTVYSMVITEKLAKKLFGDEDPMGKIIRLDNRDNVTITGVMKDLPNNTDFTFEYLLPWSYMHERKWDDSNWNNNSTTTYVLLRQNASLAAFNNRVKNITIDHLNGREKTEVFLYALGKQRLYSKFENGQPAGGRIETVRVFAVIAAFILLIACINFMNLSTARSEKRAKEVGIRKVIGAQKGGLVTQFLGESVFISFIAALLSIGIVQVSLPAFNRLTEKQLYIPYDSIWFWLSGLVFILFTGLIAGSYPAFYLSAFRPVRILKGTFKAANTLVTPRKVLVVMQFTFAIILIIATIIVDRQIRYAQDRATGYSKANLAYVFMDGDITKNYTLIKNELLSSGAVLSTSKTSAPITEGWSNSWEFEWAGKVPNAKIIFDCLCSDGKLVKTAGMQIAAGRDIDPENYPTDSTACLLNESAVKMMGFKQPLGQIIKYDGISWHVAGAIKDFILRSPYEALRPMVIMGPKGWFYTIHIKFNPQYSTAKALAATEKIFKKYNPQYPFEYHFVDEEYAKKFSDEQQISTLATLFAGLTIFISCLGLFGLATYMAENRIKEIGIRKVLGAGITGITALMSKDFLKLVVIAILIASPVAWWAMHKWLGTFNYHVSISWKVFVLSGLLAVAIALLTVSYQAIRAALANPVKSLRSE